MLWERTERRGEIHTHNWANYIRDAKSTMVIRNSYEVVKSEKGREFV
jgi:hypothetical protein